MPQPIREPCHQAIYLFQFLDEQLSLDPTILPFPYGFTQCCKLVISLDVTLCKLLEPQLIDFLIHHHRGILGGELFHHLDDFGSLMSQLCQLSLISGSAEYHIPDFLKGPDDLILVSYELVYRFDKHGLDLILLVYIVTSIV